MIARFAISYDPSSVSEGMSLESFSSSRSWLETHFVAISGLVGPVYVYVACCFVTRTLDPYAVVEYRESRYGVPLMHFQEKKLQGTW